MNTSHTPGPWRAVQTDRYNTDIQGPRYSVAHISIGHDDDVPEMQDNARLIAAAPELLEALQEVLNPAVAALRALDRYPEPMETDPLFSALELVRAAIAKATRSPSGDTQP